MELMRRVMVQEFDMNELAGGISMEIFHSKFTQNLKFLMSSLHN